MSFQDLAFFGFCFIVLGTFVLLVSFRVCQIFVGLPVEVVPDLFELLVKLSRVIIPLAFLAPLSSASDGRNISWSADGPK